MKIRYHLNRRDYSRGLRHAITKNRLSFITRILCFVLFGYAAYQISPDEIRRPALFYSVMALIVWFLAWIWTQFFLILVGGLSAFLPTARDYLGERSMQITDEGLETQSRHSRTTLAWSGINIIERKKRFLFLMSGADFYMVPTTRPLLEGDVDAFEAEVRKRVSESKTNSATTS